MRRPDRVVQSTAAREYVVEDVTDDSATSRQTDSAHSPDELPTYITSHVSLYQAV